MKNNKMHFVGVMLFACVVSVAHAASFSSDDEFWGKISSNVENSNLSFFDFDNDSKAKSTEGFSNLLQEGSENSLLSSYLSDTSFSPLPPMQELFDDVREQDLYSEEVARTEDSNSASHHLVAVAAISAAGQRSSQKRMTRSSQAREKGNHICPTCRKSFRYLSHLKRHEKTHLPPEEKEFACDYPHCNYATDRKEDFNSHKNKHLPREERVKPFKCGICNYSTDRSRSLKRHINRSHAVENSNLSVENDSQAECAQGFSALPQESGENSHMPDHLFDPSLPQVFPVDEELPVYSDLEGLPTSIEIAQIEDSNSVNYDSAAVAAISAAEQRSSQERVTRTSQANEEDKYKCRTCERSFRYSSQLDIHEESHLPMPPEERLWTFKCGMCDYVTYQIGTFNRHVEREHASAPALQIDEELSVYSDLEGLPTTIEVAQIEDSNSANYHPVAVAAISAAEQRSSQARVTRASRANEEGKHICPTCRKSFSRPSALNNHKKTHLPPEERSKDFVCYYQGCGFATDVEKSLNQHKNTHLPPEERLRPFKCGMCDYAADQIGTLNRHVKRKHISAVSV